MIYGITQLRDLAHLLAGHLDPDHAVGPMSKAEINHALQQYREIMSPPPMDQVLEEALQHWGEQTQWDMAIGELGELLAMWGKRAQGRDTQEEWIDEIADGLLVLTQLSRLVGAEAVEERLQHKLTKLRARVLKQRATGVQFDKDVPKEG